MKKLVSLLLVFIMVFAMLATTACLPEDEKKPVKQLPKFELADGETYDGSAVEIQFSHTMGEKLRNVLDDYIVEFNKIYPNITVIHSQVGGWGDIPTTISQQILAGEQPNIAYCYPDHVALYNLAGATVTLDQFIYSPELGMTQAQIDDFIDGYWNEGKVYGDGLMYTLPLSKSTEVLYYNKTYFEANNISVPTTWEQMEAVCRRILEIEGNNPNCKPLGYDSEANWFITMTEQLGTPYTSATGTKYTFDTPENRAFVQEFASWYYEGLLTTQEIFGAYTSNLFVQKDKSQAYSYMSIGSTGGASNQVPADNSFEVGIAPIPQVDPSNPKAISQGPSLVLLNNENRQEVIASYLFMEFLTTNLEFQSEFSMISGYMPVLESVMTNPTYKSEFLDKAGTSNAYITSLAVQKGLEIRDWYYVSPAFAGSSVAREEVGTLMQNVFVNYGAYQDKNALLDEYFKSALAVCERKYPSN